tara:strand:+ start:152 stop:598 length:447 start_codon:yes stop_codon:yes gene_type:complete
MPKPSLAWTRWLLQDQSVLVDFLIHCYFGGMIEMVQRLKPILGMWATLSLLSVALFNEATAPPDPMFGTWPTVLLVWLLVALFFDWVLQTTGMNVMKAAVVLALTQILGSGVPDVLMSGVSLGEAIIASGFGFLFWVLSGFVYGKLLD